MVRKFLRTLSTKIVLLTLRAGTIYGMTDRHKKFLRTLSTRKILLTLLADTMRGTTDRHKNFYYVHYVP